MIVSGTGHRGDKFFLSPHIPNYSGHSEANPLRAWIRARAELHIRTLRPLYVVSGLAIGFDQDLADVCVKIGQPFIAAVPFAGQEDRWPLPARQKYRRLLRQAYEVVVVSEGGYTRDAMLIRNMWMVDHCNVLLAAFDGSPGGTAHTVNYANRIGRDIVRIDPNDFRNQLQGAC